MSRGDALEAAFPVHVFTHSPEYEQVLLRLTDDGCGVISSGLAPVRRSCRENAPLRKRKGHQLEPMAWCFMVPQIRFERTTPALGERCSIP